MIKLADQPTIQLTRDQIEFYHNEGYLVLDKLVDEDEVDRMREVYDRLFESQAGRNNGGFFDLGSRDEGDKPALPQMMNPSRYAPEIEQFTFRAAAAQIARQLQGPLSYFRQDLAICKPPGSKAHTPWHQDAGYNDPAFDYDNINFWVPLQPATLENGCLQFIPKSHLQKDILPHHRMNHDPKIEAIECEQVDLDKAVACPLPPGGCTIHHARTLHYAGPNSTDQPRRAYILEFEVPPHKRDKPQDFPWNHGRDTRRIRTYSTFSAKLSNKLFNLRKNAGKWFGAK
ncbi:MAG: phytanoyl-CoA dioxygenase family protein [Phycisphaera sp.]|nr:phytanoyl-CoA dioxygenase family protein [Phycisphaera sp.]